jgi:hypothetical protein
MSTDTEIATALTDRERRHALYGMPIPPDATPFERAVQDALDTIDRADRLAAGVEVLAR